jgi:AraC-like DNA-binding protein
MEKIKGKTSDYFGSFQKKYLVREGMEVITGDFVLDKKQSFEFLSDNENVQFVFVLSGRFCNRLEGTKDMEIDSKFAGLWLTPALKGSHCCLPDFNIRFVCINMKRQLLKNIAGDFFINFPEKLRLFMDKKKHTVYSYSSEMSFSMENSTGQILNCRYDDSMKKLFIEAKALELITEFMFRSFGKTNPSSNRNSSEYMKKITKARDIILEEMENPPTIKELSKLVGLSETNLKKGFKKIFKSSVYAYLRTKRMEKAKTLLETGKYNVTEVSYKVGYSSPAHFAKVFASNFKTTPKKYISKF